MSIERAREYLSKFGMDVRIREFDQSSATVELAAVAVGVDGCRIAKTMSFMTHEGPILIVFAGDVRVDNRKYKDAFHIKAKMLTPQEVHELIGHDIGGVCPFGINDGVVVYLDLSLRRFETVFPAAGSDNSAVEMTPDELFRVSGAAAWVDVSKMAGAD